MSGIILNRMPLYTCNNVILNAVPNVNYSIKSGDRLLISLNLCMLRDCVKAQVFPAPPPTLYVVF